jgi:TRAP transporter 4TM/12TM fusion protein
MSVHFEAGKLELTTKEEDLPKLKEVAKEGWFYLLPFVSLIYFMVVRGLNPEVSAIYSMGILIAASFLNKNKQLHLHPGRIWVAFQKSIGSWLTVAAVTAGVGMLVGALELSGLGLRFSSFLVQLGNGNLLLTLVLVGLGSFILGMGLDSIPAYMTLAVLTAPALVGLGVPVEVAHLFVLYWGMASFITPPTCLAVYVACGISGSKVWQTGWEAVRLGAAVYIVPFMFVYNPALLGRGELWNIVLSIITALIGATFLAGGLRGYMFGKTLHIFQILLLCIAGLLFIAPGYYTAAAGVVLGFAGYWLGTNRVDKAIRNI